MPPFDIAPFALPGCNPGEVRFEEPRDIETVVVTFHGAAPRRLKLSYLQRVWPEHRYEAGRGRGDLTQPAAFGWIPIDDHFNTKWQPAATSVRRDGDSKVTVCFRPLHRETADFPEAETYNVTYRRTLGVRVEAGTRARIRRVQVFTRSQHIRTRLRVELDAGRRTPGKRIDLSAYNAKVAKVTLVRGVRADGAALRLGTARRRAFHLGVAHMRPVHRYCGDEGHVTFTLDDETFTISLATLGEQGPIWCAEQGVYIAQSDDPTDFGAYRAAQGSSKTILQRVAERPEQTLGGAFHGQPRPHAVEFHLGCQYARQRFAVTPHGDILLRHADIDHGSIPGRDTDRAKFHGQARFFFGLERWMVAGRYGDPGPVLAYNVQLKDHHLALEQKALAVPLQQSILVGELAGDEPICALVRFRITNTGDQPARCALPLAFADGALPLTNRMLSLMGRSGADDWLVPTAARQALQLEGDRITSHREGETVLRCVHKTTMAVEPHEGIVLFNQGLDPGQSCELVLKIPFIALDTDDELAALQALDFDTAYDEARRFWQQQARRGARLATPEPSLDQLHDLHLVITDISDVAMPDDPRLINTSVGTSTYGNFTNESCMIVEDLQQRGLFDEARRRLAVWLKYQSSVGMTGRFSDQEGVFYGAGGFESGQYYNQHHGWALWALANQFLYERDARWFGQVADAVIAGADWVFRQRRHTMGDACCSRGWEHGFLPPGGLEDVGDFWCWLSTNALTWRGIDTTARALELLGHAEAPRIRAEADAYRCDLIAGFDRMRRYSPLVRLHDGRWVPNFPSRIYRRGRDIGWIREVLEGSVYLLIAGLYPPQSREADWILNDFQDNRYHTPPFGYVRHDPGLEWIDRGGFSIQPNLLAGLLPHLDRDEPEVYIWMCFNALASCLRQENGAISEHPMPELGYSNSVAFKTSDQANAVKWLRYMFVYWTADTLYFGRAVPRYWFDHRRPIGVERVATPHGSVSVTYDTAADQTAITAEVDVALHDTAPRIVLRFRPRHAKPIRKATVNGKPAVVAHAEKGDVDLTGLQGQCTVIARY